MSFNWRDIVDDIAYCKMAASATPIHQSGVSLEHYFPYGDKNPYVPFKLTNHQTRFDIGVVYQVPQERFSLYSDKHIPTHIMRGGVTRNGNYKKWHMGNTLYLWDFDGTVNHPKKIQVIDYAINNKGDVSAKEINIGWFDAHSPVPLHHEYNRPFHIRIENYKKRASGVTFEKATCIWSPILRGKENEAIVFAVNHKTGIATNTLVCYDTDIIGRFHTKIDFNVNIYENQWFNNPDDEFTLLTEIASVL
jgi:hypothetical protein